MKTKKLRVILPLVVLLLVTIGYVTSKGIGTISAFGWGDIAILCPVGALTTMLASKLVIPRAIVSFVVAAVLIVIFARAFCAWICPVPLVSKLRNVLSKGEKKENPHGGEELSVAEGSVVKESSAVREAAAADVSIDEAPAEHLVKKSACSTCGACGKGRSPLDSRHVILGGSLLTAAIFGFPVFCLICPIGLTLATILLVMLLFSGGDVTWSVIVVPVLLVLEVVVFRKWCSKICPLSALMSLIGKANKTFVPQVDTTKCLESTKGSACGVCAKVCEQGINPRNPEAGASWSECTKCRECVEACPAQAISMPLLPKAEKKCEEVQKL